MTTNSSEALPIEPLTPAEVDLLLRACSKRAPSGLRDRALIGLLYGAGLRIAEALNLLPRDLDLTNGSVVVRKGKGGKRRVSAISEAGVSLLEVWLAKRDKLGCKRSQPVFCAITVGKIGQSIAQANVRQMLARRTAKAGLDKRVHAHGFRHSHAAELAGRGVQVHVIQQQLGHSSLAVTSRYVNHLRPQQVIDAVRDALRD